MVTFICPTCHQERTGARRRCYPCTAARHTPESREKIRRSLTGVKHSPERRLANARATRHYGPDSYASRKGRQPSNWKAPGSTRIANGHTQIKCPDGKWRYRARVMWEEANGPIPVGRLIHHINRDPHDDRLENFQLVTIAEHMRIHMLADGKAQRLAERRNRTRRRA